MINGLIARIRSTSDFRGKQILKNILWSAGLKGVNALISFIIVPLYLSLLTELSFGIWLTVSAVLQWFNFFDLGIGNGLRNKLAEALAQKDYKLGKIYVSTTYALISGVAVGMFILFFGANFFFDWAQVFEAPPALVNDVRGMVIILFCLFVPQFVAQLIKMVVTADQRPALSNLMNTLVNILQLAGVFLLSEYSMGSLVNLAWVIAGINLFIPLVASAYLFSSRYKELSPSFSHVDLKYSNSLLGLGATFFILQGAALVVFMTDNLIITKVLGPEEVPAYNISYRYFNLALVFFGLVTTPFWSAFTDAFVKEDFGWIKKMLKRLLFLWVVMAVGVVLLILIAPYVYHFWIGDELEIPSALNWCMGAWVILSALLSIFGTFLSGIGKLKVSLFHAVFVMIVNIPLSIWLAQYSMLGSAGVILASTIGASFRLLFQPYQTWLILQKRAKGIWNR
ncbi:MATE family efflux transporter [Cryomorphaceae bacterium 1068]|nr:MATE family efflux transporter [Cryomorphaceae bacterium 1068]